MDLQQMKLLVVDDDDDVRGFLKRLLKTQKFEIVEAASGEEALYKLSEHPDVALMLLDWMMPGMSGLDVLCQLREQDDPVPILMLSAKGGQDDVVQALDNGAMDYIYKPVDKEHLLFKINGILDRERELAHKRAARRKSVHLNATSSLLVVGIDAEGVVFETSYPLLPGSALVFESRMISEKLDLPREQRFSCRVQESGQANHKYRSKAAFLNLSPLLAQKIKQISANAGWTAYM